MRFQVSRVGAFGSLTALVLTTACGGAGGDGEGVQDDGSLVIDGQEVASAELMEAAQDEDGLILYTGSGEAGERQLIERFQEETGLDGDLVRVVPNQLTERIISEHQANQLGADVIRIDGWDLIDQLVDAEVFRSYSDIPSDISIPDEAVHEDGLYFTTYNRPYLFAYNHEVADEELTSWEDLIEDGISSGDIGLTQVRAAGSSANLVHFQLDVLGEEWLSQLADTSPRIFDSASPLTDAMARGELVAGPVPSTVGMVAIEDGAPITLVAPEEGFPVNEYIVGLSEGGDSPNTAEVFLNWTLSDSGQLAALELGDYPINPELGAPDLGEGVDMPPLDDEGIYVVDPEEYQDLLEENAELWEELFGYTG